MFTVSFITFYRFDSNLITFCKSLLQDENTGDKIISQDEFEVIILLKPLHNIGKTKKQKCLQIYT